MRLKTLRKAFSTHTSIEKIVDSVLAYEAQKPYKSRQTVEIVDFGRKQDYHCRPVCAHSSDG
jgi:hypothetical protein